MRILSGRAAVAQVKAMADRGTRLDAVEPKVRRIIADIRRDGDAALLRYARKFDGLTEGESLRVDERLMRQAWKSAAPQLRSALREAAGRIRRFCQWQKPREWQRRSGGISLGQLVRPVASVGCYVPSGRHPLVSTLLMTVIPAQVAGVNNIRVASARPHMAVLAAAAMLGVREVYRVGGAQAIAALAYGTESIPRVEKVVGPGNLYVTAAKKLVSFDCAIDFLAGPTEVVILSDRGNSDFLAADLVAQAEHDSEAMAIFITTHRSLAQAVAKSVSVLARKNPTARESLQRHGAILLAASREQALDWANQIAPEHITVDRRDVAEVRNAGSVFVGEFSPQAAGDYASGPNHVLPTAGAARFRGGLSVLDFVKLITVQELSRPCLRQMAPSVQYLAETEGLLAHAESIRMRCARA